MGAVSKEKVADASQDNRTGSGAEFVDDAGSLSCGRDGGNAGTRVE